MWGIQLIFKSFTEWKYSSYAHFGMYRFISLSGTNSGIAQEVGTPPSWHSAMHSEWKSKYKNKYKQYVAHFIVYNSLLQIQSMAYIYIEFWEYHWNIKLWGICTA